MVITSEELWVCTCGHYRKEHLPICQVCGEDVCPEFQFAHESSPEAIRLFEQQTGLSVRKM